jgi:hypothetical protein
MKDDSLDSLKSISNPPRDMVSVLFAFFSFSEPKNFSLEPPNFFLAARTSSLCYSECRAWELVALPAHGDHFNPSLSLKVFKLLFTCQGPSLHQATEH